ncbi:MAG: glutathione S-transferase family protein [Xenococcaceae cyanobacterium MO_167.B27]|nr:glutathione S-transferase family protein [Xenococcaceae cyanobacterium MO_167.B27]
MLKFYYHPLSPISRRVWIALLEKKLTFESIIVDPQDREQFQPEFLQLNPFHHIPVIVDDGLRIIESLAILDYLETKYPEVSLLPSNPETLAKVRMVQMVTCGELVSQVPPLIIESEDSAKLAKAKRNIKRVMSFFSELLGDDIYFGGEQFTVGDIVAGNAVISISKLGFDLSSFSNIDAWNQRLQAREVWQKTQPSQEKLDGWAEFIRQWLKK